MTHSYETLELIASHHAELSRTCRDLLEEGSRIAAGDPRADAFRERIRALAWRMRIHRAEEVSAHLSADGDRSGVVDRVAASPFATLEGMLARSPEASPLELAKVACEAARTHREHLDAIALS